MTQQTFAFAQAENSQIPKNNDNAKKPAKFDIILCDPPWDYGTDLFTDKANDIGNVKDHYPTMSIDEMCALNVQSIAANDCLLYMWVTGPYMMQANQLIAAWGFNYVTVAFVWNKARHLPGYYTMSVCEFVLVAKRGRIPQPRGARDILQYVEEIRTRHSKKPKIIYSLLERMHPTQNKIELFARYKRDGWYIWGNELINDVVL